jgi:chromosome segregation ATPase
MEIAKASVAAAERRESDIRVECEMLQIYILKLGAEKEILNKRLEVAQKQYDKVDKELRNVKDLSTERDSLRAEVALLKKQVETAESQYADTGNKDEFQFEKEVDMMQDEYKNRERELELLLEERTSYRILRLWQRFRERFKRRGQKRNSKI